MNLIQYDGVATLVDRISRYELIITSKLHVGIVGTALGRKVISLPVHHKTTRFYSDLGLSKFCLGDEQNFATQVEALMKDQSGYVINRNLVQHRIKEMMHSLEIFLRPQPDRVCRGRSSNLAAGDP